MTLGETPCISLLYSIIKEQGLYSNFKLLSNKIYIVIDPLKSPTEIIENSCKGLSYLTHFIIISSVF